MDELRGRVERDEYRIDAEAIARVLVERLTAGRTLVVDDKEH